MAAAHLIGTGLRNLYAVCLSLHKNRARIDGFAARAYEEGAAVSVLEISRAEERNDSTQIDYRDYLDGEEEKRILDSIKMPAGIFAYDDEIGAILLRAAQELGIKVPEELSVIGFDDSQIASFAAKPLSTVRQRGRRISRIAFDSVIRGIDEGETTRSIDWVRPELILRESTRCNVTASGSDVK